MGQFVVSARKYRPRRFDEVLGQEHVTQTLKNALRTDQLAHAFLFCGPRGIGKTTCARILAKVLNCENPTDDQEPCNSCDSCAAFDRNSSFNVIELDAASNNSVEHIRSLIDQVRFQPQQGQYKVFIIDEVHMLSTQAFNAFLKTLEEPPPYAIFILATTEKHKIIPTILSRCQVYDFKRIQVRDMVRQLQHICDQEDITADPEALHIIAQKADGALRDALSIFDRLANFSSKRITYEDTISNLNVLDYDYYFTVFDALLTEDLPQIWTIFNEILSKGFEGDTFMTGLAEHARNLLVCQDAATHNLLEIGEKLKTRYEDQANSSRKDFLLNILHLANECDVNYRMARNKRLHIEITLAKMAYINRLVTEGPAPTPDPAVEKKTVVDTKAAPEKSDSSEAVKFQPASAPDSEEQVPVEDQNKPTQPQPESETKRPVGSTTVVRKRKSNTSTPSLPSLESMDKRVREAFPAEQEIKDVLDMKEIQEAWDAECINVQSPSVRTMLESTNLHVEGKKLVAMVGSNMSRSMLMQEKKLIQNIRDRINCQDMALEIQIDPKLAQTDDKEVERPLTIKEKYNKLLEINPKLKAFKERFDLRVDLD